MTRKRARRLLPTAWSSLGSWWTGHRRRDAGGRPGARRLCIEPCERRNLLAVIGGTMFEDISGDGFSLDDVPAAGVSVDLYQAGPNGTFDGGTGDDVLVDTQVSAPGTGAYLFEVVTDGRYYLTEQVPAGYEQTIGPDFYTIDVAGSSVATAVGRVVDQFDLPNPGEDFLFTGDPAEPNPLLMTHSDPAVLGGQREVAIEVRGTPGFDSADGVVGFSGLSGIFHLATAGVPGTRATLTYDGTASQPLTGDLTDGGRSTGIRIDFNSVQAGVSDALDLRLRVLGPEGSAEFRGAVPENTEDSSSYFIPFSSPNFRFSGPFSFREVTGLELVLNETDVLSVDFEIEAISATSGFDFGNFSQASVHGTKFLDVSGDGFTPDDLPLGGVTINLYQAGPNGVFDGGAGDDVLVDSQVTATGTGAYAFGGLAEGRYFITEQLPPGYTRTFGPEFYTFDVVGSSVVVPTGLVLDEFDLPNPGEDFLFTGDPAEPNPLLMVHSDPAVLGGQREVIIQVQGTPTFDSADGVVGFSGLSGIFHLGTGGTAPSTQATLRYDGTPTEPLTVDLTDGGQLTGLRIDFNSVQGGAADELDLIARFAGPAGSAEFRGAVPEKPTPGTYFIPFSSPDFRFLGDFSFTEVIGLDLVFNDDQVIDIDFEIEAISATSGFDFGNFARTASVSGTKYLDVTGNGFSPDDGPLGDVTIELYQAGPNGVFDGGAGDDVLIDTRLTDSVTGAYRFEGLTDGRYYITEQVPVGYTRTIGPDFYTFDVSGGSVVTALGSLVDDFELPDPGEEFLFTGDPVEPNPLLMVHDDASILGGQREVAVEVLGTPGFDSADGVVGFSGLSGILHLATAGEPATQAGLTYDGTELVPLSVDLTDGGQYTGVRVDFNSVQAGMPDELDLRLRITSPAGSATYLAGVPESTGPVSVFIPFSGPDSVTGSFSPADVNELEFVFNQNGVINVDFQVEAIGLSSGFDFGNFPSGTPGIDLEKSTNGQDADTAPGPQIAVGDTVTWTYVVTNTGNVPLDGVDVSDDQGVTPIFQSGDTDGDGLLDTDETWVYQANGPAVAGQYANMATVTALDPQQTQVGDQDPSHYFGLGPGIHIEKSTNGQDADTAPGPQIAVGETVTWTYVVTNTGNVPLDNVNVSDDQGVAPVFQSGDTDGDNLLDTDETWIYGASGIAVAGQYANTATVNALDPQEALVGDQDPSHYFGFQSGIHLEKSTNGQDADTPPGPQIPVGETVTWTYVVTNTGNVPLDDVDVSDDQGVTPVFQSGDTDGDGLLDTDETWIYGATGTAVAGQYANMAAVTALGPQETQVGDQDPSHYLGLGPGIHLEKSTDGQDADTPTGPQIPVGEDVTWTYVVTNTGNVPLSDVTLTDDQGAAVVYQSGDTDGDDLLDTDEIWTYRATGVAMPGQYANVGTVTSLDPQETEVSDQDPSHYYGVQGGIHVEKSTNGQDADAPIGPQVLVGESVTWTYVVTNTGNVPLSDVTLTDDQGMTPVFQSGDTDGDDLLDTDETWTYGATGTAIAGQYANTATVTALDPRETQVTDEDPSHYYGVTHGIHLEKATNGRDADTPSGPYVAAGDAVTWTFVVTNPGDVPLSGVTLTDDQGVVPVFQSGDTDGDGLLDTDEAWIYEAGGTAIAGQYANLAAVTALDPFENQVGDEDPSHYFGVQSGIHIEKSTNGQDADAPIGPQVSVGDTVTWTYVVTNAGNVPLSDVTVTDDQGVVPVFHSGDIDGDGLLDVGEAWIYGATGVATAGQYGNQATATGLDPLEQQVASSDPSHYFGVGPGIDVEKSTNGQDADSPTGPLLAVGEAVAWTYVVTNTGNVPLSGVTLTDDQGVVPAFQSGDADGDGLLGVDETWTYEATGLAVAGQYANTATVAGEGSLGNRVTDQDPSHYFGVAPGIELQKSTNGQDADSPTGPLVPLDDPVTWTYRLTNTGNVPLSDVTLTDDQGVVPAFHSGDTDGDGLLGVEEIWIYEATGVAVAGQYANTATVTALDPLDRQIADEDPSHYFGAVPGIHLEKLTNGQDADSPAGPELLVGEAVTWTYQVTNTGNVPLSEVTVSDDQGVVPVFLSGDTDGDGLLGVEEIWIYEATGVAVAGQYANTATAAGRDPLGAEVTDQDPSHYFGWLNAIHLEKSTNGHDADTPTGPEVAVGDPVTWTYVVTNTGNAELSDVTVSDDQGVVPVYLSGDVDVDGLLDLDETWIYEATALVAGEGQYANLGTVTAEGRLQEQASASDPSHYLGRIVPSSISGFVYVDINNNGIKEPNEAAIPNTVLTLTGADTLGSAVNRETTTDADGRYVFGDLLPGEYSVTETQPAAYVDGKDTIGTPGGVTSNDQFSEMVLPSGFDGQSNNFGEWGLKTPLISKRMLVWPRLNWFAVYDGSWQPSSTTSAQTASSPGEMLNQTAPGSEPDQAASEPLVIEGTDGDDRFEVSPGRAAGSWSLTVNGQARDVGPGTREVEIRGLGGRDEVALRGTDGEETLILRPDSAVLTGEGFTINVSGAEAIAVDARGGRDTAEVADSEGQDTFRAWKGWATMDGPGFAHSMAGFETLIATAGDGFDLALLYDSVDDDTFDAAPTRATLSGEGFSHQASFFDGVHCYATAGGYDLAKLHDSVGHDTFYGTSKDAGIYDAGYFNRAKYFEEVQGFADQGGFDVAKFYDSDGDDRFLGTPGEASLRGDGYYNRAFSFEHAHAYATAGGHDVAELHDSPGDDHFYADPVQAALFTAEYYNRAKYFEAVDAVSTAGGYDVAELHDSDGDDLLEVAADWARIHYLQASASANGFDRVTAISSHGGSDTKRVEAHDFALLTEGTWLDL